MLTCTQHHNNLQCRWTMLSGHAYSNGLVQLMELQGNNKELTLSAAGEGLLSVFKQHRMAVRRLMSNWPQLLSSSSACAAAGCIECLLCHIALVQLQAAARRAANSILNWIGLLTKPRVAFSEVKGRAANPTRDRTCFSLLHPRQDNDRMFGSALLNYYCTQPALQVVDPAVAQAHSWRS